MFGGRIAEELIYGKDNITTGAGNDIQQATNLAKRMVKEFGFSDKLGPLRYESNQEEIFLGHSVAQQTNISDETARLIDTEIRKLVQGGETKAKEIISKKIKDLHVIAKGLLEYETLTAEDIKNLLTVLTKFVIRLTSYVKLDINLPECFLSIICVSVAIRLLTISF